MCVLIIIQQTYCDEKDKKLKLLGFIFLFTDGKKSSKLATNLKSIA